MSSIRQNSYTIQVDSDEAEVNTPSESRFNIVEPAEVASPNSEPVENPLPFWQVWTIGMVAFLNILNMVIIFPFLPFFTAQFFPDLPTSELGTYVGLIASSYFFGDMLGSMIWGPIADKFGRKPAMQFGLITSMTGLLLFPFAPNFAIAMVIRFLTGMLSGNNSLTRTMMSEICDNTNQARGFSVIGMSTGLARLFAPGIGGILALPATKYPSLFPAGGFNDRHPFFLPCFVGAALTAVGQIMSMYLLTETLKIAPAKDELTREAVELSALDTPLVKEEVKEEARDKDMWSVVKQPAVINIMVIYFLHSFVGVSSHEIVPMWVINSKEDHGFGFDTSEVGLMLSLVAPFQISFQAWVYPILTKKLKFIGMFKACALVYGAIIFVLPFMSQIASWPTYLTWPLLILAMGITNCARIGAFTCIFVLLSNCCHKNVRASVNGFGQSVSSAGRMFGPTVTGSVFAWSLNNGMIFPFNFHCAFIIMTIFCVATFFMAQRFDPILDYQKDSAEAKKILAARAEAANKTEEYENIPVLVSS